MPDPKKPPTGSHPPVDDSAVRLAVLEVQYNNLQDTIAEKHARLEESLKTINEKQTKLDETLRALNDTISKVNTGVALLATKEEVHQLDLKLGGVATNVTGIKEDCANRSCADKKKPGNEGDITLRQFMWTASVAAAKLLTVGVIVAVIIAGFGSRFIPQITAHAPVAAPHKGE